MVIITTPSYRSNCATISFNSIAFAVIRAVASAAPPAPPPFADLEGVIGEHTVHTVQIDKPTLTQTSMTETDLYMIETYGCKAGSVPPTPKKALIAAHAWSSG